MDRDYKGQPGGDARALARVGLSAQWREIERALEASLSLELDP